MKLEQLRTYLLTKKGVTEEMPFGPTALVFKVMGKMYALVGWQENPLRINLKCDPEHALALRAIYDAVIPGYHMNKDHWNSVILNGSIHEDMILTMIDDSYNLVVKGLKQSDQKKLEQCD